MDEALEEGLKKVASGPQGRYSTIGESVNRKFDEPYSDYYGRICEAGAGGKEECKQRS